MRVTFESDSEEEEDGNEEDGEAVVTGDQRPSHGNHQDSVISRPLDRMQVGHI